MINIDGIVVVEGKDDKTAVSRVIHPDNIYILNGMSGANQKKIDDLKRLAKNNKIYILTDPDFAGKKIREKIKENIPTAIDIYASKYLATKKGNVGIENMSEDDILDLFQNIHEKKSNKEYIFSLNDILDNGLNNRVKRELLGDLLSIGYCNNKKLVKLLNILNISKKDFDDAVKKTNEMYIFKTKNAAIFGKFFPVHKGHVWFIKQVARYCRELYVFVCEETLRDKALNEKSKLPDLSIKDRIRFLEQELKGYKNIHILKLNEDGIEPYPNGWEGWTKRVYEKIKECNISLDCVFTNETQDKENYDKYFDIPAYLIDPKREGYSISSTMIRNDPTKYIEYMPNSVKKWYTKNKGR
ncbi:DUF4093 domain-containing protein [uncultured Sneathia sp.]|uniref:DUF4093 domain-containing protein n=1 Tax=uncultured Sneathia sp. TaxID=278067 RepID=UPI002595AB9B|nr:DUF4093 domain-containing protein [uncultured Sneathia sp.]